MLDGVRFVFQHAPQSEAPAELTFYLPDHGAFCGAEIVSRTMHNLYTLRGAKVRDAFGGKLRCAVAGGAAMPTTTTKLGLALWAVVGAPSSIVSANRRPGGDQRFRAMRERYLCAVIS